MISDNQFLLSLSPSPAQPSLANSIQTQTDPNDTSPPVLHPIINFPFIHPSINPSNLLVPLIVKYMKKNTLYRRFPPKPSLPLPSLSSALDRNLVLLSSTSSSSSSPSSLPFPFNCTDLPSFLSKFRSNPIQSNPIHPTYQPIHHFPSPFTKPPYSTPISPSHKLNLPSPSLLQSFQVFQASHPPDGLGRTFPALWLLAGISLA